jgi:hypothetical protein
MLTFITDLKGRNESLFYFGCVCFAAAILFGFLSRGTRIEVMGVNAWYKPIKFALSIGIYSFTMGWLCHYLPSSFYRPLFNSSIIVLLGFEILYIAIQAGRGQLSHFNLSTPFYSFLYTMMALAASLVTVYTMYVALLFFINDYPFLPNYYLWSIRWGLIIFVIFSFEGFVMGSRLTHTIGGADGSSGIPFLNWSTKFGDPRIAHFIGMHALQVLPFLSFYILKSTRLTFIVAILYGLLAILTLLQALQGKPFHKI